MSSYAASIRKLHGMFINFNYLICCFSFNFKYNSCIERFSFVTYSKTKSTSKLTSEIKDDAWDDHSSVGDQSSC